MIAVFAMAEKNTAKKTRSILSYFGQSASKKAKTDTQLVSTDRPNTDSERPETSTDHEQSDLQAKNTSYEKRFQNKWLSDFPWLLYDSEKNSMTCSLCIKHKKHNSFTDINKNFRTSTLTRHADSSDHKAAVLADSMTGDLQRSVKHIFDEKESSVLSALKVVYWMAKEDISITKYDSLLNLLENLDCPNISGLKCGKSVSYSSDKSATELMEALAYVARKSVDICLEKSPFISLLCDESTDISVDKKLIIYARILDPDTYKPSTHFITNVRVKSATGKAIFDELNKLLKVKQIPISKVMGFGSDSAKVMTGTGNGVTGFMLRENPMLLNYHCIAHRLALVTFQAANEVPFLVDYQSVLTGMFYFFKHSANRTTRLTEIQTLLDDPKLKIKEVHEVRWLSVYLAVQTVYKCLDSLITFFSTDTDAKAKGYGKKLIQQDFIASTYMLMDVLPIVSELCLVFQKSDLDVSMVKVSADHCKMALVNLKSGQTHNTYMKQLQNDHYSLERGKVVYKKNHIVQGKNNIDSIQQKFIDALLVKIDSRFPEDDSNVMYAFAALAMRPISFCSHKDLQSWGDDKIETLVKQFGEQKKSKPLSEEPIKTAEPLIDPEATRKEWSLIKPLVINAGYPRDNMSILWSLITKHHKDQFPNLLTLAALGLTAPIHTSDCERGFSAQNQVKIALRSRLSPERVNDLVTIKLESDSLEKFNFGAALEHWRTVKQRKFFMLKNE